MSDSSTSGFLGGSLSGQEGECRQEPIRGHPQGKSLVTAVLAQAAWAAKRKKHSYLKAQHYRLVIRRGKKRAIVAVDHTILIIAYDLLKQKTTYQDLGEDFFDRLNATYLTRHLVKRLEKLGHKVKLESAA